MRLSWTSYSTSLQTIAIANIYDFSEWIEKLADNIDRVPTTSSSILGLNFEKSDSKHGQILHLSDKPAMTRNQKSSVSSVKKVTF